MDDLPPDLLLYLLGLDGVVACLPEICLLNKRMNRRLREFPNAFWFVVCKLLGLLEPNAGIGSSTVAASADWRLVWTTFHSAHVHEQFSCNPTSLWLLTQNYINLSFSNVIIERREEKTQQQQQQQAFEAATPTSCFLDAVAQPALLSSVRSFVNVEMSRADFVARFGVGKCIRVLYDISHENSSRGDFEVNVAEGHPQFPQRVELDTRADVFGPDPSMFQMRAIQKGASVQLEDGAGCTVSSYTEVPALLFRHDAEHDAALFLAQDSQTLYRPMRGGSDPVVVHFYIDAD